MTQNMCERKTHKIKSMTTISRMGNDFQMVRGTVVAKYRRRFLLPDTAYVTMTIYIYIWKPQHSVLFLTAKRSTTQNARTWRHDGRKDRPFRSHVTIVILDLRVDGRTVVCTTIHAQFPG
jgi:hypothetical protein